MVKVKVRCEGLKAEGINIETTAPIGMLGAVGPKPPLDPLVPTWRFRITSVASRSRHDSEDRVFTAHKRSTLAG